MLLIVFAPCAKEAVVNENEALVAASQNSSQLAKIDRWTAWFDLQRAIASRESAVEQD